MIARRLVASEVTIIDTEGDVYLDLEKDGKPFGLFVNQPVLRPASPVRRAMLMKNSPFQKSLITLANRNIVQVFRFKEDDFLSMETTMNIMHLQNHRVPQRMTLDRSYNIVAPFLASDLPRNV